MKEPSNPKLKVLPVRFDRVIEVIGWIILVLLWGMTIWAFMAISGDVPIHFNFRGEPDRYGSIGFIILIPVITTLIMAGITWLNRYPHIFNYPVKITPDNALKQYTLAIRLLRIMKLSIALIFFIINLSIIAAATGTIKNTAFWFTALIVVLIIIIVFLPLAIYLSKSFQKK